jgi:hypothetical protein
MNMRVLGIAVSLGLCCSAALAASIAKPGVTPVEAELMADLHARILKVGTPVFARVTVDWKGEGCTLRRGAVLEAQVTSVVPHIKNAKASEVGLAFTKAQCGEMKMGDFGLVLSAMAAPPQHEDLGMMSESLPVLAMSGMGGVATLRSMHTSAYNNYDMEVEVERFPLVPQMQMGYVSGIRGLKLDVGSGPENSTVLSVKDHDVALVKHTMLLLIPSEGAFPRAGANSGGVLPASVDTSSNGVFASESADVPVTPPVEEIDQCEPPHCNVALPAGDATDAGSAAATISIGQLGYASRSQREMNNFDHDEALAYLGPRELLVTFNPHKLVTRHTLGKSGVTMRIIRAALVDTQTRQVTRTVDWELSDTHQYLWPLPEGRVLVHVGSELHVYGRGLKLENRVSLDGPLAFVRVTPDGNFIAAGIIHERHSSELHARLRDNLEGADPEEDVQIVVLNRKFETIAKSTARSGLMAPTLLNEGQAKLQALPEDRYRIAMQTWDGQSRTVTRFTSSCTPELSSIAPDLLFLVSCAKQTEGREYRVLRPDGKLVLKGDSTLSELGHAAEGITGSQAFVVKTVQSTLPAPPGVVFRADELASEELRVYRAADGKRVFGVRVSSPSSSRDGYALAPDGSQLAVLNRDQIAVYPVSMK